MYKRGPSFPPDADYDEACFKAWLRDGMAAEVVERPKRTDPKWTEVKVGDYIRIDTPKQIGGYAVRVTAYQGREIVLGFDMTGHPPRPWYGGLSFRAVDAGCYGGPWHLVDLHRPLPLDYEACDLGSEGLVVFERKVWPEGGTTFYRGDALFQIKRDEELGISIQALR
jgi:hypothetical protein